MCHLDREADIGCELFSGGAAVFEALDMQEEDFGHTVQPHTLRGLRLVLAHLAPEALLSLHQHCLTESAKALHPGLVGVLYNHVALSELMYSNGTLVLPFSESRLQQGQQRSWSTCPCNPAQANLWILTPDLCYQAAASLHTHQL